MRVLLVSPSPYVDSGGIAVHVRSIAERLAKRHEVTVYAPMDSTSHQRREIVNGVNVERFKCYSPNDSYVFSVDMPLRMRQVEFDVVHGHGYHCLPLHFSAFLGVHRRFVVTPHFHGVGHTSFRNGLMKAFRVVGRRTMDRADCVVAVSEFEKSLVCEHLGIAEDRVVVVPNGVSFSEFTGVKKRDKGFRSILYVGYLVGFKGAQYLVEVMPKLADDIVLEIVGKGPLKPYLEKRVKELNIADRVRFYPYLSRGDLVQKFVDADVFGLLSRYEAYSIVVAEALAAGTPCVVSRTSALTEWVDGESCFGVDFPISLSDLARKLNVVLEDGVRRDAMRKWVGGKLLDWDDVAARIERVYSEGLGV